MSNSTSPILLPNITPYSAYAVVVLCFATVVVSCFSFVLINRWTLKDEKFRRVLYLSSGATLIIAALWAVELLLKFFGYKFYPIYWAVRYARFWICQAVENLMKYLYFILVFILLGKLSMSHVKVSRLIWLAVLTSSLNSIEVIYEMVVYHMYLGDGKYAVDTLNFDLYTDPLVLSCGGIFTLTSLLEIVFIIASYFYVKSYLRARPVLQANVIVNSTVSMLRRLAPIFVIYLLPVFVTNLISFLEETFPNAGMYQSSTLDLIQVICFYYHWSSVAFLPVLVKWSIQPPPPGPLQRIWHSHILPSAYHTSTLREIVPPRANLDRRVLKIVHVQTPSDSAVNTSSTSASLMELAAVSNNASAQLPTRAHFVIDIEDRVEDRDVILSESDDDVIARMERAVANFLGFVASPNVTERSGNSTMGADHLPPRHVDAFFGHQQTADPLDFEALDEILGQGEGAASGYGFGFDPRLRGHREEGGREDGDMFEMNSLYNRDGKNLVPEGLL